jgi:hypothetical protein
MVSEQRSSSPPGGWFPVKWVDGRIMGIGIWHGQGRSMGHGM